MIIKQLAGKLVLQDISKIIVSIAWAPNAEYIGNEVYYNEVKDCTCEVKIVDGISSGANIDMAATIKITRNYTENGESKTEVLKTTGFKMKNVNASNKDDYNNTMFSQYWVDSSAVSPVVTVMQHGDLTVNEMGQNRNKIFNAYGTFTVHSDLENKDYSITANLFRLGYYTFNYRTASAYGPDGQNQTWPTQAGGRTEFIPTQIVLVTRLGDNKGIVNQGGGTDPLKNRPIVRIQSSSGSYEGFNNNWLLEVPLYYQVEFTSGFNVNVTGFRIRNWNSDVSFKDMIIRENDYAEDYNNPVSTRDTNHQHVMDVGVDMGVIQNVYISSNPVKFQDKFNPSGMVRWDMTNGAHLDVTRK